MAVVVEAICSPGGPSLWHASQCQRQPRPQLTEQLEQLLLLLLLLPPLLLLPLLLLCWGGRPLLYRLLLLFC